MRVSRTEKSSVVDLLAERHNSTAGRLLRSGSARPPPILFKDLS
jgi:hypothetical protein